MLILGLRAASLMAFFLAIAGSAFAQDVTTPLVGGYLIDLPPELEMVSEDVRRSFQVEIDELTEGIPGAEGAKLVLLATCPGSRNALILAVTVPSMDEYYRQLEGIGPDEWSLYIDRALASLPGVFGPLIAASRSEDLTFSRNDAGDIVTVAAIDMVVNDIRLVGGERIYIRPGGSFEVFFAFPVDDPIEPAIREAVASVRRVFRAQ